MTNTPETKLPEKVSDLTPDQLNAYISELEKVREQRLQYPNWRTPSDQQKIEDQIKMFSEQLARRKLWDSSCVATVIAPTCTALTSAMTH